MAASAVFLLRKAEKGQKAQVAADEFAVRYASQNGYTSEQAAAILLSALQQVAILEDRVKNDYDTTMRRRNLEFLAQRGLGAGTLTINPKYRNKGQSSSPNPFQNPFQR